MGLGFRDKLGVDADGRNVTRESSGILYRAVNKKKDQATTVWRERQPFLVTWYEAISTTADHVITTPSRPSLLMTDLKAKFESNSTATNLPTVLRLGYLERIESRTTRLGAK
jgi:hypothetical protein